eukprot:6439208-Prymnesium_polylepis.2
MKLATLPSSSSAGSVFSSSTTPRYQPSSLKLNMISLPTSVASRSGIPNSPSSNVVLDRRGCARVGRGSSRGCAGCVAERCVGRTAGCRGCCATTTPEHA